MIISIFNFYEVLLFYNQRNFLDTSVINKLNSFKKTIIFHEIMQSLSINRAILVENRAFTYVISYMIKNNLKYYYEVINHMIDSNIWDSLREDVKKHLLTVSNNKCPDCGYYRQPNNFLCKKCNKTTIWTKVWSTMEKYREIGFVFERGVHRDGWTYVKKWKICDGKEKVVKFRFNDEKFEFIINDV